MALTVARTDFSVAGGVRTGTYTVTFDSSYPTGGESFAAVSAEFRSITDVVQTANDGDPNQVVTYTTATDKLKLWLEDDTSGKYAEAGSTSDQSAIVAVLTVTGR